MSKDSIINVISQVDPKGKLTLKLQNEISGISGGDIKKKLAVVTGVPEKEQILKYKGRPLPDNVTLGQLGFQPADSIILEAAAKGSEAVARRPPQQPPPQQRPPPAQPKPQPQPQPAPPPPAQRPRQPPPPPRQVGPPLSDQSALYPLHTPYHPPPYSPPPPPPPPPEYNVPPWQPTDGNPYLGDLPISRIVEAYPPQGTYYQTVTPLSPVRSQPSSPPPLSPPYPTTPQSYHSLPPPLNPPLSLPSPPLRPRVDEDSLIQSKLASIEKLKAELARDRQLEAELDERLRYLEADTQRLRMLATEDEEEEVHIVIRKRKGDSIPTVQILNEIGWENYRHKEVVDQRARREGEEEVYLKRLSRSPSPGGNPSDQLFRYRVREGYPSPGGYR